jgi:hypothetical protein
MPFYIRGGAGPMRYSHRVGGRKRSGPPSSGGQKVAVALLATAIFAFFLNHAVGITLAVMFALIGLLVLWLARR